MIHRRKKVTAVALVMLALFSGGTFLYGQTLSGDEPGPATDRITFGAFDVDRASRDLEAGNMDLYMFGLKIDAAEQLAQDPDFKLYRAPASTVSILL
ncbi:MAG: hypothetical protein JW852_04570, partial [Spirochaetales bacterium]|nr:hypothetical protein [Spirochaetales bacterium]